VRTFTHLPDACLQFVSGLNWGSKAHTEEFKGVGVAGANSLQNSAACKAEGREAMQDNAAKAGTLTYSGVCSFGVNKYHDKSYFKRNTPMCRGL
jgi:hypothetical protein